MSRGRLHELKKRKHPKTQGKQPPAESQKKLNIKTSAKRYQFLHLACQEGDLTLPPSVKLLTS